MSFDEWSRRLSTELAEWSLERHEIAPPSRWPIQAGSSATVGFGSPSEIARALNTPLMVRLHQESGCGQRSLSCLWMLDIRRLLHQFAAGFLKDPGRRGAVEVLAPRGSLNHRRSGVGKRRRHGGRRRGDDTLTTPSQSRRLRPDAIGRRWC
jgi:chemosensory pili system protein ChpA (sensor histidine kinase/response regulator)